MASRGHSLAKGNIAAIELSTTCSLAYSIRDDRSISTFNFDHCNDKTINSVLLKKTVGDECRVVEFGQEAKEKHSRLKLIDLDHHIFFEDMKILRDEVCDPCL